MLPIVLFLLAVVTSSSVARPALTLDRINVDQLLRNERLLKVYTKCLLNKGRCTQEGNELKKILPEVIQTNCAKCTPGQRGNALKVMAHLSLHKPELWRQLKDLYDPTGMHLRLHKNLLSGHIKL